MKADRVENVKAVKQVPRTGLGFPRTFRVSGGIAKERRRVVLPCEAPRTAEIVLRARAADGREFAVSVEVDLEFALAPPRRGVLLPGEKRADVMALAFRLKDRDVVARTSPDSRGENCA